MSSLTPPLSIPAGSIRGIERPDGTREFRGIRYARADRFTGPVDEQGWQGEFIADTFSLMAPQIPGALESMLGFDAGQISEDCHFLNVFTPRDIPEGSKLPVLFWIHGGAYNNGAGSLVWYNGSSLARKGAVVVTINYRLGALGFLGDGNMGLLDMVSALRWVNRNISAFGGDDKNVTIFGESAGGSAVLALMACPTAEPLFHKVWAMSPSIGQLRDKETAMKWQALFLEKADADSIQDLSNAGLESILAAQTELLTMPSRGFDMFAPTAGGDGVSSDFHLAASTSPKPLVIGTNRDENKLWSAFDNSLADAGQDKWEAFTADLFGDRASEARRVYEERRPGEKVRELISAVNTDTGFRQRAQRLAEARSSHELPTWMYWFTWQTPAFGGILGSCHALDIPFAFDNLDVPGAEMMTGDGPERQAIADRFSAEILQFATHGHPSWAQFDLTDRSTLVIDSDCHVLRDPESDIRSLFL